MGYISTEGPEVSNPLKYFTFNAQMDRYSTPGKDYLTKMQESPVRLDNPLDKLKDLLGRNTSLTFDGKKDFPKAGYVDRGAIGISNNPIIYTGAADIQRLYTDSRINISNYNLTGSFYQPGIALSGKNKAESFYDRFSDRQPQIAMPNRYAALSKHLNYLHD